MKNVKSVLLELTQKPRKIWRIAGGLKKRKYLKIMPLLTMGFMIYAQIVNLYDADLERWFLEADYLVPAIKSIVIYLLIMIVNIRFYPWVKEWCSNLPLVNKVFPANQMAGLWFEIKFVCRFCLEAIRQIPTDHDDYYDQYGFYSFTVKRDSTRINTIVFFLINEIFVACVRLIILNSVCLLSCIFGWFAVPSILKKMQ